MANPKYQFIESRANLGATLKAAFIKKQYHEEKKLDYHQAIFPGGRIIWAMFKNEYYDKEIEGIKNGDEEVMQYYKHENFVPRYHIYRNNVKIGIALPRNAHENSDKPYLFIPETKKYNRKKRNKPGIGLNYYIFDIDDDYLIKNESILYRYLN